ncbi:MAG TPA: CHAP domain-containing protein [Sphingobium sp.]|uniref:CHAP domain-containing protein n=1 Tax=Sphingobium sp. TaxID=1912891 RepID=UPI002ED183C6
MRGLTLPLAIIAAPSVGAGVLQCVPYAREISGVRLHGDAWTWWGQARGHYARGTDPRPGAVIALADTDVMPLGHVAVVSKIIDDRHILLRHANWSGPGLIEKDVLAVDSSAENDWSQIRIWWGQSQQMGVRDNPVNGFIYPKAVSERAVFDPGEPDAPEGVETPRKAFAKRLIIAVDTVPASVARPRLTIDPALFRMAQDSGLATGRGSRTLAMIVQDVRREARLP